MQCRSIRTVAQALGTCALTLLFTAAPAFAQYELVRGNFHVHTSFSGGIEKFDWSDAVGQFDHYKCVPPTKTLEYAQAQYLWVVGLSDHGGAITTKEWEGLGRVVEHAGTMVALRGFEWTYGGGKQSDHVNVFGTESYTDVPRGSNEPIPQLTPTLNDLYCWLKTAKTTPEFNGRPIAQFNHIKCDKHFADFANRDPVLDNIFCLAEIGCGEAHTSAYRWLKPTECEQFYKDALNKGWHVAPSIGIDNQLPPGGQAAKRHTAIWVLPESGRAGVIEAVRARRVFASEDRDARVRFLCTIDGETAPHWMGETVHPGPNGLTLSVDLDVREESFLVRWPKIVAYLVCPMPNMVIRRVVARSTQLQFDYYLSPKRISELLGPSRDQICVYLRVHQTGGPGENDHIYTAPIWISRE